MHMKRFEVVCIYKGIDRKIMSFGRTKDLDCYEVGKKKIEFDRTKNLKLYEYSQEKAEKSWFWANKRSKT